MGVKGQCGQKYIVDVLIHKILHRCSIIQEKHTLKMLGHVMILTPLETNGSLRSAASKKIVWYQSKAYGGGKPFRHVLEFKT